VPNPIHPYFHLKEICQQYHATLVAVSKTRTIAETEGLYQMGQRVFAENRVQGLLEKALVMHPDIEWHLIGHLQTNKVRSALPYVACIQSLDRLSLWEKIQEESYKLGKTVGCLLQLKIATEETKYGWQMEELTSVLKSGKHTTFPNVQICGVMGMASLTEDMELVRREMKELKSAYEIIKASYFADQEDFNTISMGMSGDYQIALEEGSTMIRIGSLLFT